MWFSWLSPNHGTRPFLSNSRVILCWWLGWTCPMVPCLSWSWFPTFSLCLPCGLLWLSIWKLLHHLIKLRPHSCDICWWWIISSVRHCGSSIWSHPNRRSPMPHSCAVSGSMTYWDCWNFDNLIMLMMITDLPCNMNTITWWPWGCEELELFSYSNWFLMLQGQGQSRTKCYLRPICLPFIWKPSYTRLSLLFETTNGLVCCLPRQRA